MYALKHARMGGNRDAIADVANEVDVMKAVRGHPNVLTLRALAMNGPQGAEVRVQTLQDLYISIKLSQEILTIVS